MSCIIILYRLWHQCQTTYSLPLEAKLVFELGTLLLSVGFSKCFEEAYQEISVIVYMLAQQEWIQEEKIKIRTDKRRPLQVKT